VALSLVCGGFAVHCVFDHIALANRDEGRPMYEPDVTRDGQVTKGLLFFETDHGYNLAAVPGADPEKEIVAARLHGDDHDRLLLDRLNRPQAHAYHLTSEGSNVSVWVPSGGGTDFWRFEAEADWPPLGQLGGWAEPSWLSTTCASQQRAMTLHPSGPGSATATLELPVPKDGRWLVTPRVVRVGGRGRGKLRLEVLGRPSMPEDDKLVWDWLDGDANTTPANPATCAELTPRETTLVAATGARWILTTTGGDITLDRTTLRALH
jgi:hypothetical protein